MMHVFFHSHQNMRTVQMGHCFRTILQKVGRKTFLIEESAYPLATRLMKPFLYHAYFSNDMSSYNYRLSRGPIVVENIFGRLKASLDVDAN